jgi:hypothetical protein
LITQKVLRFRENVGNDLPLVAGERAGPSFMILRRNTIKYSRGGASFGALPRGKLVCPSIMAGDTPLKAAFGV